MDRAETPKKRCNADDRSPAVRKPSELTVRSVPETALLPAPPSMMPKVRSAWLRTRRDRSGQPLISSAQYLAGERLRSDFERAMMARRTTTNWNLAGSGSGGNAAAELSDGAIAARQRYHKAIAAVGPELASILQQVCCMAAGLEQAERVLNLPQRSGKAVLGLALTALARHYGLTQDGSRPGRASRNGAWRTIGRRLLRPSWKRPEGPPGHRT